MAFSDQNTTNLKIPGWSIKTKITLVIVLLVVCSISAIGYLSSTKGSEALSTQAEKHLYLATRLKAQEYNTVFKRISDEIEGVAHLASKVFIRRDSLTDLGHRVLLPWNGNTYGNPTDVRTYNPDILALQRVAEYLSSIVYKNDYISLGYMATENNVMIFDNEDTVDTIEGESGYIPTKRSWYQLAKEQGKTIWSQPYVDVNTKKLVVTCACPVYLNITQFYGVVGFDVLLDTIKLDIKSLDIGYGSQAILLNNQGDIIAKPDMKQTTRKWDEAVKSENLAAVENKNLQTIAKKMMSGELGVAKYTENDQSNIIAFAPLPSIKVSLGVLASENIVMQPATEIRNILLIVWAIVLVLSLGVGTVLGNGITLPLKKLTVWANQVSQGAAELSEFQTNRKDEIGVLVASFNRLVASLQIAMSRRKR